MENTTPTTTTGSRIGQLSRSTSDKVLAGVCGGLAQHFSIDPALVRLAFIVFAFAGGASIPVYVVLWIVMPQGDGSAVAAPVAGRAHETLALLLVGIGGIWLLANLGAVIGFLRSGVARGSCCRIFACRHLPIAVLRFRRREDFPQASDLADKRLFFRPIGFEASQLFFQFGNFGIDFTDAFNRFHPELAVTIQRGLLGLMGSDGNTDIFNHCRRRALTNCDSGRRGIEETDRFVR